VCLTKRRTLPNNRQDLISRCHRNLAQVLHIHLSIKVLMDLQSLVHVVGVLFQICQSQVSDLIHVNLEEAYDHPNVFFLRYGLDLLKHVPDCSLCHSMVCALSKNTKGLP